MIKEGKYKDSGFTFLGKIPQLWETFRLKQLGRFQNGISKGGDHFGFGYPFVNYNDIYNDEIRLPVIKGLVNSTKEDRRIYSVKTGDVFFTRTSETIEEIGIAGTCLNTIPKATFSGFTIRFRPKSNRLTKEFSKYFFRAHINRLYLSKEISLVTRASLSQGTLGNLPVLIPPKKEQNQIANYLDAKTKAIDKKEELLEQKILKYRELRKALINQTITHGLTADVKLKDSGVDWIGEIPRSWRVIRLKELATISTGSRNSENFENDGKYPFFVRSKEVLRIDTYSFNEEAVLTAGDGDIGKVFHYINGKFDVHQRVYCIRSFKASLDGKYLYYYLSVKFYNIAMRNNSNSIVNSLRLPLFRDLLVTVPSINEQQQIAEYLDTKTSQIDKIIANLEKQKDTLAELRKTLINDVVTGKLKVSN